MARLLVIGSSNTDMTVGFPSCRRPGRRSSAARSATAPGGKGANQAVAAAARAGAEVVFVTAVGDDDLRSRGARRVIDARGSTFAMSRIVARGRLGGGADLRRRRRREHDRRRPRRQSRARRRTTSTGLPDVAVRARMTSCWSPAWRSRSIPRCARSDAGARPGCTIDPEPRARRPRPCRKRGLLDRRRRRSRPTAASSALLTRTHTDAGDAELDWSRAARPSGAWGRGASSSRSGPAGACSIDAPRPGPSPPARVEAVDTVGAGDAFNGALAVALGERTLARRRRGLGHRRPRRWPSRSPGAQASLPCRDEIDRLAATRPLRTRDLRSTCTPPSRRTPMALRSCESPIACLLSIGLACLLFAGLAPASCGARPAERPAAQDAVGGDAPGTAWPRPASRWRRRRRSACSRRAATPSTRPSPPTPCSAWSSRCRAASAATCSPSSGTRRPGSSTASTPAAGRRRRHDRRLPGQGARRRSRRTGR